MGGKIAGLSFVKIKEQYDKLTAEIEELHKKQKAMRNDELIKAIADSPGSYEEILKFIKEKQRRIQNKPKSPLRGPVKVLFSGDYSF